MVNVVVLGGGRVGSAIVRDLARDGEFAVTVADLSIGTLAGFADVPTVKTVEADLADAGAVTRVVRDADLVVGAVPGDMGFATVKTVLEGAKNIVDISFFPEDLFELDALAKQRNVIAVVDCGVAPGCDNILLGQFESKLDEISRFACYVGGLPVVRTWPWEYKAPFSPIDVIAEYNRPARYRRDGRAVTMPALSEPEPIDFPGVGTLEAFNTDGLRSLLATSRVPSMVEKTLRYPGHIEKIRVLRETGFFSTEPIDVNGVAVRPLDFTATLLFPAWQLGREEEEITVMRVEIEGRKDGATVLHTFDMLDRYDPVTRTSSMARTTGYTCTAAVRLVARGLYSQRGISPPEYIGRAPGCGEFVFADLAKRGVVFKETVTIL